MLSRSLRIAKQTSIPIHRNFAPNPARADKVAKGAAVAASSKKAPKQEKVVRNVKTAADLKPRNVHEALEVLRSRTKAKFDETLEIAVNLGVDPRKANQAVRGSCVLPNGNGKKVRVAVFANPSDCDAALGAGADIAGSDTLIRQVESGIINFDRAIATPEMMPQLSKIGKILGPKGLMPNPKLGTVDKDVVKAVKAAKAGSVQYRVDKTGVIHAGIGKMSFSNASLLENIRSFMLSLGDHKPEGFKSKYFLVCHLSSTMGPGILVDLPTVDPSSPKFMVHPSQLH